MEFLMDQFWLARCIYISPLYKGVQGIHCMFIYLYIYINIIYIYCLFLYVHMQVSRMDEMNE